MATKIKSEAGGRMTPTDIKTPTKNHKELMTNLGGEPKKLNVESIDKVNTPSGRGRAPGAVGF